MNEKSIVGTAIASELWDKLQQATTQNAIVYSDTQAFSARLCTSARSSGSYFTGGCIIETWVDSNHQRRISYRRNLRPGYTRKRFETAVNNLWREAAIENQRQRALDALDARAAKGREHDGFIDAVVEREKTVGVSDYGKLTIDQINDWCQWIDEWKEVNE